MSQDSLDRLVRYSKPIQICCEAAPDGRIVVAGSKVKRLPQKRLDYLLRYRRDFPIAVVEAKAIYAKPGDGLQQAKEYAQILGLKFAYATNGHGIVEHDFLTGRDNDLAGFPSPDELWGRLRASEAIDDKTAERVLAPYYHLSGKSPRYYQEIAINRATQAILQGKDRLLLTLATGTGKVLVFSRYLCRRVKVVEFDEQIPDSFLPLVVFALFRLGDDAKRPFFQGTNLLLGELDQFAA